MKQSTGNKITYSVAGVVTAGLLTWGIITTVNKNQLQDELATQKEQSAATIQEKVDNYNGIVKRFNTIQEDRKNLQATNKELATKNQSLDKNATHWNWMYDQKDAEYQQEAALRQECSNKVDSFQVVTSGLEAALKEKKAYINSLQLDLDSLTNEKNNYATSNQSLNDSISSMWNVFNPFIVKSWCFKGDKQDKVYFPIEESRIPETKDDFKEIKALNKEYKNEQ